MNSALPIVKVPAFITWLKPASSAVNFDAVEALYIELVEDRFDELYDFVDDDEESPF